MLIPLKVVLRTISTVNKTMKSSQLVQGSSALVGHLQSFFPPTHANSHLNQFPNHRASPPYTRCKYSKQTIYQYMNRLSSTSQSETTRLAPFYNPIASNQSKLFSKVTLIILKVQLLCPKITPFLINDWSTKVEFSILLCPADLTVPQNVTLRTLIGPLKHPKPSPVTFNQLKPSVDNHLPYSCYIYVLYMKLPGALQPKHNTCLKSIGPKNGRY